MKIRYLLLTLVGLAISFALPTLSQEQKPTPSTSTAPTTQTKKDINFLEPITGQARRNLSNRSRPNRLRNGNLWCQSE